MLIENQQVLVKWHTNNKQWYINKGYEFTKYKDEFYVDVKDLTPGSKIKVDVKCDYCGKIIPVAWKDYIHYKHNKYSCAHCRQKKTSEYDLQKRQEYLYNGALKTCKKFGYTLITSKNDILTSSSRVQYSCKRHGINETKIYTLLLGHGCPGCAYEFQAEKAKYSPDFIEQRVMECGGILLNKNDYQGWDVKNLRIRCPSCGKPFITSYNSFTHHGTQIRPDCSKTHSIGEKIIETYLTNHQIPYIREARFEDCKDIYPLPFDFYIEDFNTCIEFNGKQHYDPVEYFGGEKHFQRQIKHDAIKQEYCDQNNICLLTIPYWDINSIDSILDNLFHIA